MPRSWTHRLRFVGRGLLAALGLACTASSAQAQAVFGPTASVQLPTFSFTTVNTTVSVPDRGGMYLGGIGRRGAGSNEFGGPLGPTNRSGGATTGASGMSVHVTIIDHAELDAQILAEARQKYGDPSSRAAASADYAGGSTAERGATALADLGAVKAAAADEARAAAMDLLAKARAAEATGKRGAAKAYYRMAARQAPADLAAEANAALQRLVSTRVARTAE